MTRIRPSRLSDREALQALWKMVFGDDDRYIETFFRLFFGPGTAAVAESEGQITAAAHCIPFGSARYIYAVATHPLWRGRGLGRAVTLAAAGSGPAYLCPADRTLMDWYISMGARIVSFRRLSPLPAALAPIAPAEYAARRERLLAGTPHAGYSPAILELFSLDGGFYAGPDNSLWAVENGSVREALPTAPGGEPYILGFNNAPPLYWGLTLV